VYGPSFDGPITNRFYTAEEYAQFSKDQVIEHHRLKKRKAPPTEGQRRVAAVAAGQREEGEVREPNPDGETWGRNRGNPALDRPPRDNSTKTGKGTANGPKP